MKHVVCVAVKALHKTRRRGRSAKLIEPKPARDAGLERRAEAVLGASDEVMQMTTHEPQEAMRLDKCRLRERCGSAGGERIGQERALQIAQTAGAAFHVRLVLRRLRPAEGVATGAHHG